MKTCLALLVCSLALAGPAAAQRRLPPLNPRPAPDFFFAAPKGSATVRGSWLFARAGSDWYDFVTDQLTVEPTDFNAPGIGLDVGVAVTPRFEVQFGLDYSSAQVRSEYRNFVDNNRLPITQQTRLRETNLSGNVKVALTDRGREVSRFAWVPRPIVPYAGAGAGAVWFNVSQVGDFVDFIDRAVFSDAFDSNGWTPSAQLFAGADVRVFRRLYFTVDGRYLWAAGDLGRDWIDFDPIDLAGFRLSAGLNVVF